METCCEYTDSVMWVSTDERRMITRMMKLIAEHPDETEIIKRPEEKRRLSLLQSPCDVVEDCPACQAGNEREAAGGGGKESAKGTGTAAFV